MSTLIRDLLSFSLLSQIDKKSVIVDLNDTVKHVVDDFEDTIKIKKAVLNVGSLPSVHAYPAHMSQLFNNLIDNALKFGKENPVINIASETVSKEDIEKYELDSDKKYVAITISDNGVGFDQKYISKMFTLFQKLNTVKDLEGSGVGLAICKKIVEDHGGIILAKGKDNEGANFTIIIPK